jgi:hypothetical protein
VARPMGGASADLDDSAAFARPDIANLQPSRAHLSPGRGKGLSRA